MARICLRIAVVAGFLLAGASLLNVAHAASRAQHDLKMVENELGRGEPKLLNAAVQMDRELPDTVKAALRKLKADLKACRAALEKDAEDKAAAKTVRRAREAMKALQLADSQGRQYELSLKGYYLCKENEYYPLYQKACYELWEYGLDEFVKLADGKAEKFDYPHGKHYRLGRLRTILELTQAKLKLEKDPSCKGPVPADSPTMKKFYAYYESFMALQKEQFPLINEWCATEGSRPKVLDSYYGDSRISTWRNCLDLEQRLVASGEEFEAFRESELFKAYTDAVRKEQDLALQIIDLEVARRKGDESASAKKRECENEKKNAYDLCSGLRQALRNSKRLLQERETFDRMLKEYPEIAKTDLPGQMDGLLAQLDAGNVKIIETLKKNDAPETMQVKGEFEVLELKAKLLQEETRMEIKFQTAIKDIREKLADEKYAEQAKKLAEIRARHKEAWTKFMDTMIEDQKTCNQIDVLEKKSRLFRDKCDNLKDVVYEIKGNYDDLLDEIKDKIREDEEGK